MIEDLTPLDCWRLLQENTNAVLVDVRTKIEHSFVGHPIGAVHIPWKEAPDWQLNLLFVAEVEKRITDKNTPILLLCRSGQRSLEAAAALQAAGYQRLINIVDGFEGALDGNKQRGKISGWRYCGLPWQQG